jgi:hypothetical protein
MAVGALCVVILCQPYLGIAITVACLPITTILPNLPYFTSIISLMGAVTLAGYLMHIKSSWRLTAEKFPRPLLWGLFFILWAVLTHPGALMLPGVDGRTWLLTYIQLLILAYLAWSLMDTPAKHWILMGIFATAVVISSIPAIQQSRIGSTVSDSVRAAGLAAGANDAARYFLVGLILLYNIRLQLKNGLVRLILLIPIGLIVFGILSTVSRTGMVLLLVTILFLLFQDLKADHIIQALLLAVVILIIVLIFANNVPTILGSILPSIQKGTDTMGIRYDLWQAGLNMWVENPLTGIGIGQFNHYLSFNGYGLSVAKQAAYDSSHNMYIQVLVETGLVGFCLFMLFVGSSLRDLWKGAASKVVKTPLLARTWLIMFIIMLLGGITKTDQYDKLVWLVMGISAIPLWSKSVESNQLADKI